MYGSVARMCIQTKQANGEPSEELFCTCWDLLPCSLRFTPPFTSSGMSPARGAFMNLGHPGTLKALQPTPLVLCPRTEMLQEAVLISGLCNVVPCASLGMCVSGNLHKFLYQFFFFPTNLPGSGVRSYSDDIPVTNNIDHIKNTCLLILGLPSPISGVS